MPQTLADSDTELHSPGSANAVTRAQAAAQNTTSQSDPTIPSPQPSPQVPGPSSPTAGESEDIDYDLYRQLTEEEVPSDQQWLRSTEELEKTLR